MTKLVPRKVKALPDAVMTYRAERDKRTINGLLVPRWVAKDPELYMLVQSQHFPNQRALDRFIAREALARHRTPTRFVERNKPEKGYDTLTASYTRLHARVLDRELKRLMSMWLS